MAVLIVAFVCGVAGWVAGLLVVSVGVALGLPVWVILLCAALAGGLLGLLIGKVAVALGA